MLSTSHWHSAPLGRFAGRQLPALATWPPATWLRFFLSAAVAVGAAWLGL